MCFFYFLLLLTSMKKAISVYVKLLPCSVMGLLNDYQRDFKIRAFSVSLEPSLSKVFGFYDFFKKIAFCAEIHYVESFMWKVIVLLNTPGRFALSFFTFLRWSKSFQASGKNIWNFVLVARRNFRSYDLVLSDFAILENVLPHH